MFCIVKSDLRPSLNHMKLSIIVSTFNVLTLIVKFLNNHPYSANVIHEILSELLISHQSFFVVVNSELFSTSHWVAVKQSSPSKAWQIFTVAIASEDKSLCFQTNGLVRISVYRGFLLGLAISETKSLTWHRRYQGFTHTQATLNINFIIITISWI